MKTHTGYSTLETTYNNVIRFVQPPAQFHIPVSLVTLLSCGKTSPGKLNLLEEVILIPKVGQQVKQVQNRNLWLTSCCCHPP